jgi:site-specific recombinase XerD
LLGCYIEEVEYSHFEAGIARYREGRPERDTGYRLISDLNNLIHWAVKNGYRKKAFVSYKTPTQKCLDEGCLSREKLAQVVEAIDCWSQCRPEDRLILRGLASLGLRVDEAVCFSLERVNFKRWEYVQDDKSGHLRMIPIPLDMQVLLCKARQELESNETFKIDGRRLISAPALIKLVAEVGQSIDEQGLTPILLSRSFTFGR